MRRIARFQPRALAGSNPAVPAARGPAVSCRHMQQRRQHLAKDMSSTSTSRTRMFSSTAAPRNWTRQDGTPATAEEKAAIERAEEHFAAKEAAKQGTAEVAAEAEVEHDVAEAAPAAEAAAAAAGTTGPRLVLPGQYAAAPRPDKIADVGYVPAESGEGLETVGGLQDWWEQDEHWDPAVAFRGFGPAQRVTEPAVLEVLARQAVLEAVAVQQAAAQQQQQPSDAVRLTDAWRRGGAETLNAALGLQVEVDADGRVARVQGDVAGVVAGLAATDGPAEDDGLPSADEASALLASSSSAAWKDISLADPALKFAVTKRILQLTGHMLADAHVATADTAGALLGVLVRPPKPTKLADELAAAGEEGLAGLPNVAVYGRRVTPIDKAKMAGSWKVIVQELEQRGLPVTGTGGYAKAVERKWATQ